MIDFRLVSVDRIVLPVPMTVNRQAFACFPSLSRTDISLQMLDNVQAAVLNVKISHLSQWIEHRRGIAALYLEGLQGISELRLPHFDQSTRRDIFQNYVIRTEARDRLREHLTKHGVETLVHWPKPMWKHEGLGLQNPGLAETEKICREVISLPMSAETTREQVEIVVDCIRGFYQSGNAMRYRVAAAGQLAD